MLFNIYIYNNHKKFISRIKDYRNCWHFDAFENELLHVKILNHINLFNCTEKSKKNANKQMNNHPLNTIKYLYTIHL